MNGSSAGSPANATMKPDWAGSGAGSADERRIGETQAKPAFSFSDIQLKDTEPREFTPQVFVEATIFFDASQFEVRTTRIAEGRDAFLKCDLFRARSKVHRLSDPLASRGFARQ